MSLKSIVIQQFAKRVRLHLDKMAKNAVDDQDRIFQQIIKRAQNTSFGKDHSFGKIRTHSQYVKRVPVREYEDIKAYVESIIGGSKDVLWPGVPKYFGKTSGTTSGVKYIPISKESIKFHISTARNAILNYTAKQKKNVLTGNTIFLSGSPTLSNKGGIATGRLSGIVNHEIPSWAKSKQLPSYNTNCIEDWESKLDKVVEETIDKNMTLIGGIPPWVQMYFERLLERSGKKDISSLFPNLKLFVHGGVNYAPYKSAIDNLMGKGIDTLETYPASEGFIAFQNDIHDDALLLNTNAGIFYEFIEADKIFDAQPERLTIKDVRLNKDYAVILSTNAGLWAYNIGDTVSFTSKNPYKVKVTGRIKHFISAFGEHVISKEVEEAMNIITEEMNFSVNEFTVAPQVAPNGKQLPYHEWFIEFQDMPSHLDIIEIKLNEEIVRQNIYYRDLIEGNILQTLKITPLQKDAFRSYMKSIGKLGGQNKVPRLMNDRNIADALQAFKL